MVTMRTLAEFDPFLKRTIGFDSLFRTLDSMTDSTQDNYPPYNIVKNDNYYKIEVSVSGFSEEELSVVHENYVLTISGSKDSKDEEYEYLHKGIASRDFVKKFTLSKDLVVVDAAINDGLLVVTLELVVPEEKKPRVIDIKSSPKLLVD
jgi:molecular chaperone IbpA